MARTLYAWSQQTEPSTALRHFGHLLVEKRCYKSWELPHSSQKVKMERVESTQRSNIQIRLWRTKMDIQELEKVKLLNRHMRQRENSIY